MASSFSLFTRGSRAVYWWTIAAGRNNFVKSSGTPAKISRAVITIACSKSFQKYFISLAAGATSESAVSISGASPKTATMLSGWFAAATNLAMISWTLLRIERPTYLCFLNFNCHACPTLENRGQWHVSENGTVLAFPGQYCPRQLSS